jgi:hypothetical protein
MVVAVAAAYAECGRLAEAVDTARRSVELASAQGRDDAVRSIRERLQLYEARLGGLDSGASTPPP